MRVLRPLMLACIATVLAATAAAQVQQSPALSAELKVAGSTTLVPGESADILLSVTRTCASPAQILPAGTLQVHVVGSSGAVIVTGPTSIAVQQQVCAQEPQQLSQVKLNAKARTDLGENFTSIDETLVFQVHSDAGNTANPAPSDAVVSTLFVVVAPEPKAVAAAAVSHSSPGAGIELAAGLLGLVAAARRYA